MARLSAGDLLGWRTGCGRRGLAWALPAVGVSLLLALFPVYAGDIWMHLASARLLLRTGRVPTADVFLYTAAGRPWVDHSWLAQLFFYACHRLGGVNGLVAARMLLAALGVFLFWRLAVERGARAWIAGLVSACLAAVAAPYFITRPLMFAPALAAAMLLLLSRPTPARIVAACLVELVWANLHASFPLGIAIAGCALLEHLTRWWWGRRSPPPAALAPASDVLPAPLRMSAALLGVTGVTLLNPNTWRLHLYVLELNRLPWVRELINEWRPPEFWRAHNRYFLVAAIAAWGLLLLAARRRSRVCVTDMLLLAVFTWQAFTARRFILLWSFLAMAPVATALSRLLPNRRRLHLLCGLLLALLVAFLVVDNVAGKLRLGRMRGGIDRVTLPVGAVAFLEENGIRGNIACAQYAGGYLEWRGLRPATDGRCLVNDPATMRDFNALARGTPGWKRVFPRPGVSDVLLVQNRFHQLPLRRMRGEWAVVYWDDRWMIWLRRAGPLAKVAREHDLTAISPDVLPYEYKELPVAARKERRRRLWARIRAGACGLDYTLLGYTRYVEGVLLLARACALRAGAKAADKDEAGARTARDRARRLLDQGVREVAASVRLFDRGLLIDPDCNSALYAKARSLVWLGRDREALRLFAWAAREEPLNWVDAERSAEYAARSLGALYGDGSPPARSARALGARLRAMALADGERLRAYFRKTGRAGEMPGWLR